MPHSITIALLCHSGILRETLMIHLKKEGFKTQLYDSVQSYQKTLYKNRVLPDVLIGDIDHFDFNALRDIHLKFKDSDIKVIAFSNYSDMDCRLKAVRANVDVFMLKPPHLDVLTDEVKKTSPRVRQKIHDVLIIDDSVSDLKLYQHLLEKHHVRVRFITNPKDTLTELETHKPDLILVDYMMPEATGLDIVRVIRQLYAAHDLPIQFLTGTKDEGILTQIQRETGNPAIQKSLGHDHFLHNVMGTLSA